MNGATAYIISLPIVAYYLAKRKPRTCPTPLADPVLLAASLLISSQIGLQYIEAVAGILSTGKEGTKRATQVTLLLFTIIYTTRGGPWYVPLALTLITIRWYCHVKHHDALFPAVVLAPISLTSAALYAAAHAATKKIRPGYWATTLTILAILTILYVKGYPYALPTIAITLGALPNTQIEEEKAQHTRQIYV